jgi:hypothetical protein
MQKNQTFEVQKPVLGRGGRRVGAGRPRKRPAPRPGDFEDSLFSREIAGRIDEAGRFLILAGQALIGRPGAPQPTPSHAPSTPDRADADG